MAKVVTVRIKTDRLDSARQLAVLNNIRFPCAFREYLTCLFLCSVPQFLKMAECAFDLIFFDHELVTASTPAGSGAGFGAELLGHIFAATSNNAAERFSMAASSQV